jgi:Phenylalanyl-tRNA synthetase alpha subunit
MVNLKKIKDEFLLKLNEKLNLSEINLIKTELFGKNGLVSSEFKKIGTIPEQERKKFASDLNIVKDELQELINSKINEIEISEINEKLKKEKIDVTLPERSFVQGKIHPVSQTIVRFL